MRRRTLGLALSGILAPSLSYALGLGEIAANSALNQPLDANIELVSTSASEIPSVTVHLAPNAVFDQVGIERSGILDSLSFTPSVVNGTPVIKVTSSSPIQEPFLNFVIEVAWPKGKLLREYTVLLDPPVFGGATTAATAAVQPAATARPVIEEPVPAVTATADTGVAPVSEGLSPFISSSQVESYPVADVGSGAETFPVDEAADSMPMAETFPVDETMSADSMSVDSGLETYSVDENVAFDETSSGQAFEAEGLETFAVNDAGTQGDYTAFDDVEGTTEIFVTPPSGGYVAQAYDDYSDSESTSGFAGGDNYEVNRGDTLYEIARDTRPDSGVSVNRMMAGFLQENPAAFINNNINLLRSGFILRVPDNSVLAGISGRKAKEMLASAGAWKAYRAKMAQAPVPQQQVSSSSAGIGDLDSGDRSAQSVETGAATVAEAATDTAQTALEILTPNNGQGSSSQGTEAVNTANAETLAANDALKEQLQSKAEEATELQSRVSELEALVSAKDRLIQLKDEQLSELQSKLSGAEQAAATAAEQPESATQTEAQTQVEGQGLLDKENEAPPAVETATATGDVDSGQPSIVEPTAPVNTVDETSDVASSEAPASVLDDARANPQALMGAGVGALLLAMLAWLVFRRKDKPEEEVYATPDDQVTTTIVSETPEEIPEVGGDIDVSDYDEQMDGPPSLMMDENDLAGADAGDDLDFTSAGIHDDLTSVPTGEGNEDEVLSEANVYLAYGLHDQAVDLLKPAVASHPDRNDYLAKLLEAHHATGDKAAFVADAEKLHNQIGADDEGLWQRAVVMGKDIAPEHSLFVNADAGDLSLTSIQRQRPGLDDLDLDDMPDAGDAQETMALDENDFRAIDEEELDPAGEFRLPELDELSQSLQIEEDEAITELKRGQADLSQEIDTGTLGGLGAGLAGAAAAATAAASSAGDKASNLADSAKDAFGDLSEHALDLNLDDDPGMSLADMEEELADLSTGADEINTKLDLAKAYLDMGDDEGAREALDEVIAQGDDSQRGEAKKLMDQLG